MSSRGANRAPKAEKRTLDYLEAQFRELGLKPGNGASFLQEVPMVEITAAPDAALKFTTGANSADLKFREDMVIWTKRVKAAESMEASPMVFVGYGVTRARIWLGRLRGRRHAWQDRGHPRQRSGIRHRGTIHCSAVGQ